MESQPKAWTSQATDSYSNLPHDRLAPLTCRKTELNGCLNQYHADYNTVRDPKHVFFTASMSGVIVALICTPFDVVKNHWQFSPRLENSRTHLTSRSVMNDIIAQRGYAGLWRGLAPTVGLIVPSNILFFTVYENLKDRTGPTVGGVVARSLCVVMLSPVEMLRTRTQANIYGPTAWGSFRKLVRSDAFRMSELWRGMGVTLLRDLPFSAIYWPTYESTKRFIKRCDTNRTERSRFTTNFVYPFTAAGIAAGAASIVTHPFDVVKTRVQGSDGMHKTRFGHIQQDRLSHRILKTVVQDEGVKGLFVGLGPRLAKIIPSCSILLATYEFANYMLSGRTENKHW